jgi:NAD(P)-dependent dehydrogenase (short-subunit alcohol dehydrogenase family)
MQLAIVTGVSRGLGEALAVDLLARGFIVIGAGRAVSGKLNSANYLHATCDFARPAQIAAGVAPALRAAAGRKPSAATLINSAAVAAPAGLIGRLDAAEIEAAFAVNVAAPTVMTDLFCRTFPDEGMARRIINISSGAAQTALAGSAVYSMSKTALEMLTKAVCVEQTAPTFQCITLRPGIFETGMQAYMRTRDPVEFPSVAMFRSFKANGLLKDPADVAARIVDKLVLGPVDNGRTYLHTDL